MEDVNSHFSASYKARPLHEQPHTPAPALILSAGGKLVVLYLHLPHGGIARHARIRYAVLESWRQSVEVPFLELISAHVSLENPTDALDAMMGLLVGDGQRRLLLGADERPSGDAMSARAELAVDRWLLLFGQ